MEEPAAEQQEAAPVAEDNQEMEVDPITRVQRKKEISPAAAEDSSVAEATQEVTPPAEEPSSPLFTCPEGEQGQEEVTDIVNDISEQSPKEEPSGEKENTLREEDEEAVLKEDEMDEEGGEKNLNKPSGFSMVLRGSRNKVVPPTSKSTSKRMRKKALEKEDKGRGRTVGGKSDRKRQRNEHRGRKGNKRRGGRGRAQFRRGEAKEDLPVSHKMVLRRKTRLVQPTRKTRSRRRGKM